MQIWRMQPNGSGQEQIPSDDFNNWFPHISPHGPWMVFLTCEKDVTGHPENKNVKLLLMSLEDNKVTVLASQELLPAADVPAGYRPMLESLVS